jgi:polyisoprenoid-binding protein YceI
VVSGCASPCISLRRRATIAPDNRCAGPCCGWRGDRALRRVRFPTLEFHSTVLVETPTGLKVTGTLRVRDISQSVTFHATRSTTMGRPRYNATVVVAPKECGVTRLGTINPVKVILDATLKRA